MTSIMGGERALLRRMFDAAVASAEPGAAVLRHLPPKPTGRCVVVGAGKASAVMAAALDAAWPDVALSGVVVTRYGHAVPAGRVEIIEAAHPVPDANGEAAGWRMRAAVRNLRPDDLVVALISGGGSALLAAPAPGVTLADKQAVNRALLASGATIAEMNTVRKHLSAIKGGRLGLAARPARLVTLVISDVPGDDPAVIASGPTVADASTLAEARAIVARYRVPLSPGAEAALDSGDETPKPGTLNGEVIVVAAPFMALRAAADVARAAGVTPLILGDALEGESRELGTICAGIARAVAAHGAPLAPPAVLLSGGETTVTIGETKPGQTSPGHSSPGQSSPGQSSPGQSSLGKGGRNTEFLLGFALAAANAPKIWALAGDSDGIDGTEDAAGAIVTPTTLARAAAAGLDARDYLNRHDSYGFFAGLGDLVITGPTLTNVNDIRAVLIT